jgi:hypothetical protein
MSFYDCSVSTASPQRGIIGWRTAHTNSATISGSNHGMDISDINWYSCNCGFGGQTANLDGTGQIGWQIEGDNVLNLNWSGGGGTGCDKLVSNRPTTGYGSPTGGSRASLFIKGMLASGSYCDYDFVGYGSYSITGGRYERGGLFMIAEGAADGDPLNVSIKGIELDVYYGLSSNLVRLDGSVKMKVEDSVLGFKNAAGVWGSGMFALSGGSSALGGLSVTDTHLGATEPFVSKSGSGDWKVSLKDNIKLSVTGTPDLVPIAAASRFANSAEFSSPVDLTANGTATAPFGTRWARISLTAGGGGGGGGGAAALTGGVASQVGGGGGGMGQSVEYLVPVAEGTVLTATIGAGGSAGNNGAASSGATGNNGGNAGNGGNTTVTGTGVNLTAYGGSGGLGAGANSTTTVNAGTYGGVLHGGASGGGGYTAGSGGTATSGSGIGAGTGIGMATRGGGGGGPATALLGGVAGRATTTTGNAATFTGDEQSTPAPANSGQGGDGGGGGAPGGAGGKGIAGGSGRVVIEWLA